MTPDFPAERVDAKALTPMVNDPISRPERPSFEPLTAELRRLHLTVSRRFEAKVAEAKNALSHSHPGASTEAILEAALDLLLDRAAKRKGLVEKPRRERQPSRSDHLPAEVKRAVWLQDGGCCARHNLLHARRIFGDAWMDRYAPYKDTARVERSRARGAEIVFATSARAAPP
jgi:hypothetical protein